MKRYLFVAVFVFGAMTIPMNFAEGGLVTYTDRAAYMADLDSSSTTTFESNWASSWNGFNSSAGYTSPQGATFVGENPGVGNGYYLYVGESAVNSWGTSRDMNSGDFLLGEGRGEIAASIAPGRNAVGMDFVVGEGVTTGSLHSVTFEVSTGDVFSFMVPADIRQFFGVISDNQDISEISYRTTLDTRPPQIAIDNFTFGTTAVVATPEPTSFAMFGIGTVVLASRRRRKN